MPLPQFLCSSSGWIFGFFSPFGIVNSAGMSMGVRISVRMPTLNYFVYKLRNRIAISYGNSMLNFFEQLIYCFPSQLPHFHSHQQGTGVSLLHILSNTCFLCLFVCTNSHLNGCEVVAHCRFDWHVPND